MQRPRYYSEISKKINSFPKGFAFTAFDFVDTASADTVNKTLSRLCENGEIRRILQGVYDVPEYSELLNEYSSPRIDNVAQALARKYNWRIAPAENTALNLLHLSTQIPNVWIYVSDGPYRKFSIGSFELIFKSCANKEISGRSVETIMVIQAIRAIGRSNITDEHIKTLSRELDSDCKERLLSESKNATAWIYNDIKKICEV